MSEVRGATNSVRWVPSNSIARMETALGISRLNSRAPALTTNSEQTLATGTPTSVTIHDDASVVAFVRAEDGQAWAGLPLQQLTHEPEGIAEVALSGNGQTALVVTNRPATAARGSRLGRRDGVGAAHAFLRACELPWRRDLFR
jgi:hypothetical protein